MSKNIATEIAGWFIQTGVDLKKDKLTDNDIIDKLLKCPYIKSARSEKKHKGSVLTVIMVTDHGGKEHPLTSVKLRKAAVAPTA